MPTKDKPGVILEDGQVMHYDAGKAPLHLIDSEWLFGIAEVLDFGSKKYAANLWRKGMPWSSLFGSVSRHLWKWWRGEDKDEETGIHHLLHAATCILFLYTYTQTKVGEDDRVSGG